MVIGFTGTRKGMTEAQRGAVLAVLCKVRPRTVVHGDAIGADADFHKICTETYGGTPWVRIRPCNIASERAFCTGDATHPVKPPLMRNRAIVADADAMIACPAQAEEQARGGTWFTIRETRRQNKPLYLVLPDGAVKEERTGGPHA